MRLFVAVNFPGELREAIVEATRPLRDVQLPLRWTDTDQLHMTLKFLGEVSADDARRAQEVLDRVAAGYSPFEVELEGVGAFPTLRSPRVVWVGVEPVLELRSAKHDLEHGYAAMGVERETRAFRPHVTVARADGDARASAFRPLEDLAREIRVDASHEIDALDLMRSRLRRSGPEYEHVHRAELTAGEE